MRNLAEGVHAGIGTARAMDAHGFAEDTRKGGLDVILHGVAGGLALPAAEGRAVVGDEEP